MRSRILLALLLVATGLSAQPGSLERVRALEKERVELAARLAPTVCAVFRGRGGGSGVVITKDGLVLSNFHVTGLANEMMIGLNDQRLHPAVVLGIDPSGDVLHLVHQLAELARGAYGVQLVVDDGAEP